MPYSISNFRTAQLTPCHIKNTTAVSVLIICLSHPLRWHPHRIISSTRGENHVLKSLQLLLSWALTLDLLRQQLVGVWVCHRDSVIWIAELNIMYYGQRAGSCLQLPVFKAGQQVSKIIKCKPCEVRASSTWISIDIDVSRLTVGFQKVCIIRLLQCINTTRNVALRLPNSWSDWFMDRLVFNLISKCSNTLPDLGLGL